MADHAIFVDALVTRFGSVALNRVRFAVERVPCSSCSAVTVLGKTTTIRILTSLLLRPDGGL